MRGDKCRYSHKYSKKGQKVQAHKSSGGDSKKNKVNDSKDEAVELNSNKKRKYDDKDTSPAIDKMMNDKANIAANKAVNDDQKDLYSKEMANLKDFDYKRRGKGKWKCFTKFTTGKV